MRVAIHIILKEGARKMPFAVNVKLQNILDIIKTSIIIKLKLN